MWKCSKTRMLDDNNNGGRSCCTPTFAAALGSELEAVYYFLHRKLNNHCAAILNTPQLRWWNIWRKNTGEKTRSNKQFQLFTHTTESTNGFYKMCAKSWKACFKSLIQRFECCRCFYVLVGQNCCSGIAPFTFMIIIWIKA